MEEVGFTSSEAMRFTGCSYNQIRYWDKVGLVKPSIKGTGGRPGVRRIYNLQDLVALRVIKSLIDNGLSLQRIQRGWKYLRREGDLDQHLAQAGLFADAFGTTILAPHPESSVIIDTLADGQFVFVEVMGEGSRGRGGGSVRLRVQTGRGSAPCSNGWWRTSATTPSGLQQEADRRHAP